MKKKINTGGAPSKKTRALHKKLEDLDLFARTGKVYMIIEKELESLTPARAFDLFTHYCARRAKLENAYENTSRNKDRLTHTIQRRISMLDSLEDKDHDLGILLKKLYNYDKSIFVRYVDIHLYDYTLLQSSHINSTNNFEFEISTTFSWAFISHFFSEQQQAKIQESIFNTHLSENSELQQIYETSTDKDSLKKYHAFLLMGNQRVDIADVTDNMNSIFYLKERTRLEGALYRDRYKDIEYQVHELPPKNSAKPISYQPNAMISLNINRPIDYIQELLSALKDHWQESNEDLGSDSKNYSESHLAKVRDKIMKFQKKKTLAGKLVDILYVYDCKQFRLTNPFIIKNLTSRWHRKKRGHQQTTSTHTINAYHKLGKQMIDKKYYKEY